MQIGGLDGVATILKAMEAHPTEAMCEHGNIAVANVVATHRVNRRLAGQAGAIELVLRMLADHVDTSVVSFTACNALIALTQDEPCNKVSYARAGGPRVVAAVAETHAGNATIAPLAHHLQSYGSSAEIIGREGGQGDAEMAAAGLGQDAVALYAKGSGGAQRLRAVTSARQRSRCYRQQIIKFSAAGKDPKKISKWRLAALDAVRWFRVLPRATVISPPPPSSCSYELAKAPTKHIYVAGGRHYLRRRGRPEGRQLFPPAALLPAGKADILPRGAKLQVCSHVHQSGRRNWHDSL